MSRWWHLVPLLVMAAAAMEASSPDPEPEVVIKADDIMYPVTDSSDPSDLGMTVHYHIYIHPWSPCTDRYNRSLSRNTHEVHTARLGYQKRTVECRAKNGLRVEDGYCDSMIKLVGTMRSCIVPQDCVVGPWMDWRRRYDGALIRTKLITQMPNAGGKPCGLVEEVVPLKLDPTAYWSPGPWAKCKVAKDTTASINTDVQSDGDYSNYDTEDKAVDSYEDDAVVDYEESDVTQSSCGGGIQRRDITCTNDRGITLHPTYCAGMPKPIAVQPCEVPCPRDCEVGEWGDWTPCEPTNGCPLFPVQELTSTGYSVRRRRVTVAESGGGALCPPLEEKRSCSTPRCASWEASTWGPCVLTQHHKICGRGKRTRELKCMGHDGKPALAAWCSAASAPVRSERCRIACAGDCVVSAWGEWTACSAPCAAAGRPPPVRTRKRHVLANAAPTGWPCPTLDQMVQHETCNTHACATYSWLTTPWGLCEPNRAKAATDNYTAGYSTAEGEPCVDEGETTRDVMCVQNNADVVRDSLCSPLRRPRSRRACTLRCEHGCRVEPWSLWTPCPQTCERVTKVRVRNVFGGEGCGRRREQRECFQPASCTYERPKWQVYAWSHCLLRPEQHCGHGYRLRPIYCALGNKRLNAAMCAGQPVPRTYDPCYMHCGQPEPITCEQVCGNPIKYIDETNRDIPDCVCEKNVTIEILPSKSSCMVPFGLKCGLGIFVQAARCIVDNMNVPMEICRKYRPLPDKSNSSSPLFTMIYDTEFEELLRGQCTTTCARDCVAGAWGEWGPCAAEAGSLAAFRFRTREILEESNGGGRECGATLQRATCILSAPRWHAGEWGVCTPQRLCGRALINRTVICVNGRDERLDESACSEVGPPPPHEATCRAPCPEDCFQSAWSDWSPCVMTKWGGRRDRTRAVLRPASDGGAPCGQLVEAAPCAPYSHSWHVGPWDDCQPLGGSPCGEGIKRRDVRCLQSNGVFVNDSFCPNATSVEPSETWCYVPCGVDCEVGEWSQWDKSECSCGEESTHKFMRRTRQQTTAAVWPGRCCPELEQQAPCPATPCMRLVMKQLTECSVHRLDTIYPNALEACGWGTMNYMHRCELADLSPSGRIVSMNAEHCPHLLAGHIIAIPAYTQEKQCKVGCLCSESGVTRAGPWSEWGECHQGARVRTRKIFPPRTPACRNATRQVSIEWMDCTQEKQDKDLLAFVERMKKEDSVYDNGYNEGSASLLAVMWTATLVLGFYGAFMLYRGLVRCLQSRRLKSITKV